MKKPAVLSSKSLLLASGIAFASLAPVAGIHAAPPPGADISIDASGVNVQPDADCSFMTVRIMDQGGDLLLDAQSSNCATTDWSLSVDDENGTYRIEVVIVDSNESSTRQSLTFEVVNHLIVIPDEKKKSINFDSVENSSSGNLWDDLGNAVLAGAAGILEFIIPSAQADTFPNVLIQSGFPDLQYDDTGDAGGSEWSLNAFELHPVNSTFFILTDLTTALDTFQFTPGANGTNTLITAPSGDINFADGTVFVDRGADFLGIGTTIPERNLQINDLMPTIRFDDENVVANAEIIYDEGDLTIDPGGDLNVEGLINAVFDGVNDIGDGLTKLVDLSANNTTVTPGKSSDAGFSMFNEKLAVRYNFRTLGQDAAFTKEGTGGAEFIVGNATNDVANTFSRWGNGAEVTTNGQFVGASSKAYKENIQAITATEALATLKSIKPVKYNFKRDKTKDQNLGFIAEDVPELVSTPGRKNMDAMEVVAMLTKVVQEQQNALEEQRKIIADLQQEALEIKREVRSLNIVSSAESFK